MCNAYLIHPCTPLISRPSLQERMFGVVRHIHDKASKLLHANLEGRVRNQIDCVDIWLLRMVADGIMSDEALEAMHEVVMRESRRRAAAVGASYIRTYLVHVRMRM